MQENILQWNSYFINVVSLTGTSSTNAMPQQTLNDDAVTCSTVNL